MIESAEGQGHQSLTPSQQAMVQVWEEHVKAEFEGHDVEATLATMTEDPYNITIPMRVGGVGLDAVREFYSEHFVHQIPPDLEMIPISRTIGDGRIVDEMILKFTHSSEMDWMLPGVPPTGKRVELPVVVVVQFRNGKIAGERVYWDQASVLAQTGLLDPSKVPAVGAENARTLVELAAVG